MKSPLNVFVFNAGIIWSSFWFNLLCYCLLEWKVVSILSIAYLNKDKKCPGDCQIAEKTPELCWELNTIVSEDHCSTLLWMRTRVSTCLHVTGATLVSGGARVWWGDHSQHWQRTIPHWALIEWGWCGRRLTHHHHWHSLHQPHQCTSQSPSYFSLESPSLGWVEPRPGLAQLVVVAHNICEDRVQRNCNSANK